jgi:hypothetical protein
MKPNIRPARCPFCEHTGAVPRDLPTTQLVRCSACGARLLVQNIIGPDPCRPKVLSRERQAKNAAAKEVLERYRTPLNDSLEDLWPKKPAQ